MTAMTDTLDPTLKSRIARDILLRDKTFDLTARPWLTIHFEYVESLREHYGVTVDMLAEVFGKGGTGDEKRESGW